LVDVGTCTVCGQPIRPVGVRARDTGRPREVAARVWLHEYLCARGATRRRQVLDDAARAGLSERQVERAAAWLAPLWDQAGREVEWALRVEDWSR
jgi:hypothetical protein